MIKLDQNVLTDLVTRIKYVNQYIWHQFRTLQAIQREMKRINKDIDLILNQLWNENS